MGGKGSGGPRVGSGRPRKSQSVGALSGSRRARARAKDAPDGNQNAENQNEQPADLIPQPPGSLTLDELAEWNELAPLAAKAGTLTSETQWALLDLCQSRVLKAKLLRDVDRLGNLVPGASAGTVVANPLLARYTTLLQRVDAGMMRFRIAPMGKAADAPTDKPADPFAEFDQATATGDGETIN